MNERAGGECSCFQDELRVSRGDFQAFIEESLGICAMTVSHRVSRGFED
jgi:hypothetical protein